MIPLDTFLYTIIIFVDITANPKRNTTVAVRTNVILTCNAAGPDNLRYWWMRSGKKAIPSRNRGVNSDTLFIFHQYVGNCSLSLCIGAWLTVKIPYRMPNF